MIIHLIIQTIVLDPSGAIWTDEASNLSRPDLSGAVQADAEHPTGRWRGGPQGAGGEDGYSGFTVRDPVTGREAATPLEGLLRRRGIGRVVVVGLATDYCVKETALDAVRLRFDTVVLGELVRPVELQPGDGERALAAMRAAGAGVEQQPA